MSFYYGDRHVHPEGECGWKKGFFSISASVKECPKQDSMCRICKKTTLLEFQIDKVETLGHLKDFDICEECVNKHISWCECKKHSILLANTSIGIFELNNRK